MKVNDQLQTQGALNPKNNPRVKGWGEEGEGRERGEVSADCLDGCEDSNESVLNSC